MLRCLVCMKPLENNTPLVATPCGHLHHAACFTISKQEQRKKCPVCPTIVPRKSLLDAFLENPEEDQVNEVGQETAAQNTTNLAVTAEPMVAPDKSTCGHAACIKVDKKSEKLVRDYNKLLDRFLEQEKEIAQALLNLPSPTPQVKPLKRPVEEPAFPEPKRLKKEEAAPQEAENEEVDMAEETDAENEEEDTAETEDEESEENESEDEEANDSEENESEEEEVDVAEDDEDESGSEYEVGSSDEESDEEDL